MKRLLTLVLAVALLCIGGCMAFAAEENGFSYDVENGGAVITSYGFDNDNPEKKLVIPETLGGYPVKAIGYSAFDGCYWLENVELPKTLKKISWYAFAGCYALREISIPYGVTVIGRGAFSGCCNVEKVTLPDSLVQIDGEAFQNCNRLLEITIPAGVERLSNYTFGGCYSLKKVYVKGRDTQIYRWAFANDCSSEGFETTLDIDRVIFTCWPGLTEFHRAYSPELYAVKTGIKDIRYYEEEVLPPSDAVLPPPTVEEIPEDVVETGYPVVIVPLLNNSKGEYKDGTVYDPKEDGLIIDRIPIKTDDGSDGTCIVEYEMMPCDAHGNELKFWKGEAYILFFYKDFVINGEPLSKETVALYNFKIAHQYEPGKFEYYDIDDIIFEKHGFRVKIESLSPFSVTVSSDLNRIESIPETGDNSMYLMLLFVLFVASSFMAVEVVRKKA